MTTMDTGTEVRVIDEGPGDSWCVIDCTEWIDLVVFTDEAGDMKDGLNRMMELYPGTKITEAFKQLDDYVLRYERPTPAADEAYDEWLLKRPGVAAHA